MKIIDDELSVDFLMLADRAEAINGKLYVMGGAWDHTFTPDVGQPIKISLALGVLVPWSETNQQHSLAITVEDSDGKPVEFHVNAEFTAGRPPIAGAGETQRLVLALPDLPVTFPRFGEYVVTAYINGEAKKRIPFKVVAVAPPYQVGQLPGQPRP